MNKVNNNLIIFKKLNKYLVDQYSATNIVSTWTNSE